MGGQGVREQRERAAREDALAAQYQEQQEQRVNAVAEARAHKRAAAQADVDKVPRSDFKGRPAVFCALQGGLGTE